MSEHWRVKGGWIKKRMTGGKRQEEAKRHGHLGAARAVCTGFYLLSAALDIWARNEVWQSGVRGGRSQKISRRK